MALIVEGADAPDLFLSTNPQSPYMLAPGDSFRGTLSGTDFDRDFLAFDAEAGISYVASYSAIGTTQAFDNATVLFWAEAGTETGSALVFADSRDGAPASVAVSYTDAPFSAAVPGLAFLEVRSNGYRGEYEVALTTEVSGSLDTITRTAVGETFESVIGYGSANSNQPDVDRIGIDLEGGVGYVFDLTAPAGGRYNFFLSDDPNDPFGQRTGEFAIDDGVAQFEFNAPTTDTYFLVLEDRFDLDVDTTGNYAITSSLAQGITVVDDDNGNAIDGTAAADRLEGRGGDDTINGMGGDDTLFGGDDNDILRGDEGNDILDGGAGGDRLIGGLGNDRFTLDNDFDSIFELDGEGFDSVLTSVDFTVGDVSIERMVATGRGSVRLNGSEADEFLIGNNSSNILFGNGGRDVYRGEGGNDFFVINGPAPDMQIVDYESRDKLAIDDQLLGLGNEQVSVRTLTADVARGLLQSRTAGYNARNGELSIDLDGEGPGGRTVVATIEGGAVLGFDDILLF